MIQWQKLDRDSSISVIESVKPASDPGMMSVGSCEVERAWLPFYEGIFLFKVTNFASLPSFTFEYLGDSTFFHYLDGTADAIYATNDKAELHLNEVHVLDYIDFFFSHTHDPEDGDIVMLRNPQDMPMMDSLDPGAFESVMRTFKAPVAQRNENGAFVVNSNLYIDGVVVHATINVTHKGRVTMGERKMSVNTFQNSAQTDNIMV